MRPDAVGVEDGDRSFCEGVAPEAPPVADPANLG
jgi:hypothetical protein